MKKINLFLLLLLISCGELPENKKSVWEPQIINTGHLAIEQIFDDLSDDKEFFGTYEVDWWSKKRGNNVDGRVNLKIPEQLWIDAKAMGAGNYPNFGDEIELLLRDALVSTNFTKSVDLDISSMYPVN